MPPLFYHEHQSLGTWWPRTSAEPPVRVSPDGARRKIRGVVEVSKDHVHLPLRSLAMLYGRDGALVATQGPEHAERIRRAE